MFIVKYKLIFISVSVLAATAALVAIFYYGLNFGIDFTGGTILRVEYAPPRPSLDETRQQVVSVDLPEVTIQPIGENDFMIRTVALAEEQRLALLESLSFDGSRPVIQKEYSSIGPILGRELSRRAWIAVGVAILAIVLYISFAFRKVSRPVSSWKYGIIAVLALLHDVAIPTGVFAVLGHFYGVQIDILFISAILAILGFSVHDTIVVFDRVRENLKLTPVTSRESFAEVVGRSLSQTFVRSINTSLTVIIVLLTVLFLGGDTTRAFAGALVIGIFFGTYSSIFLASPLLILFSPAQQIKR